MVVVEWCACTEGDRGSPVTLSGPKRHLMGHPGVSRVCAVTTLCGGWHREAGAGHSVVVGAGAGAVWVCQQGW
jgi:hypothetical protein